MKRAFLGVTFLFVAPLLGGCPMYGSGSSSGYGYAGSDAGSSSSCNTNGDCGPGYECDGYYQCVWVGYDATADCSVSGCPAGEVCELANGVASCVSLGPGGYVDAGSTSDVATSDGATNDGASTMQDGSSAGDGASSGDASDAAPPALPCNADVTCGGNGAKCVDGVCTPQSSLCSDTSQCANVGAACVDGVCLPRLQRLLSNVP